VHGYDPVHKITPFSHAATASQAGFRAVAGTATMGATIAAAAACQALAGERDRLAAQLREITRTHATLLEEVLRNAGQDIHDGNEAPEYLAEHYVRSLEGDLGRARGAAAPVADGGGGD
jgi:glutamate-1-semialdehyde aminotransferase